MTKVCTHGRGKREAMRQLEQSLRRLRTDYLDLWQVHECVYENDPERHFARGGVIEALDEAKRQGKVRFVGFTGHKHPDIHLEMLAHDLHVRHVPAPAQLLRRVVPIIRAAGAAGAAEPRHRAARHEEPGRRRPPGQEEGRHCARRRCDTR